MKCPVCFNKQYCGCENCAKKNKGKVAQIIDYKTDLITCGHCGKTMHAEEWEELAIEQALWEAGVTTLTELVEQQEKT